MVRERHESGMGNDFPTLGCPRRGPDDGRSCIVDNDRGRAPLALLRLLSEPEVHGLVPCCGRVQEWLHPCGRGRVEILPVQEIAAGRRVLNLVNKRVQCRYPMKRKVLVGFPFHREQHPVDPLTPLAQCPELQIHSRLGKSRSEDRVATSNDDRLGVRHVRLYVAYEFFPGLFYVVIVVITRRP